MGLMIVRCASRAAARFISSTANCCSISAWRSCRTACCSSLSDLSNWAVEATCLPYNSLTRLESFLSRPVRSRPSSMITVDSACALARFRDACSRSERSLATTIPLVTRSPWSTNNSSRMPVAGLPSSVAITGSMTQSCGLPKTAATSDSAADAGSISVAASSVVVIANFGIMNILFTAPAEREQILETFVAEQQALANRALAALGSSLGPTEEKRAYSLGQAPVRRPQRVGESAEHAAHEFIVEADHGLTLAGIPRAAAAAEELTIDAA